MFQWVLDIVPLFFHKDFVKVQVIKDVLHGERKEINNRLYLANILYTIKQRFKLRIFKFLIIFITKKQGNPAVYD